jgi:hypothetical protein
MDTYPKELTRRMVRVGTVRARLTISFVTTATNLPLPATTTLLKVR